MLKFVKNYPVVLEMSCENIKSLYTDRQTEDRQTNNGHQRKKTPYMILRFRSADNQTIL